MNKITEFFKEETPGIICLIAIPFFILFAFGDTYMITWYIALFTGIAYAPNYV